MRQQAEQRQRGQGLPAAALAGDSHDLAGVNGERDAINCLLVTRPGRQLNRQPVDLKQRARHRRTTRAVRGSSMSRKASPMKLKASTTVRIARPGNMPTHQLLKFSAPSATMAPHSAMGGWAPRPRNDSPDSNSTALPMSSAASTSTGPAALGRMSTNRTRSPDEPSSRDAMTYCADRAERTRLLTSLA